MKNNILTINPAPPLTPEQVLQQLRHVQYALAAAVNLLMNVTFNIKSPEDFTTKYGPEFEVITAVLKTDPRALADPQSEFLQHVSTDAKYLYSIIQTVTPLLPPDPNASQIIKPN